MIYIGVISTIAQHFDSIYEWAAFCVGFIFPPVVAWIMILRESLDETSKHLIPLFAHCGLAVYGMATGFSTYMVNTGAPIYCLGLLLNILYWFTLLLVVSTNPGTISRYRHKNSDHRIQYETTLARIFASANTSRICTTCLIFKPLR